MEITTTAVASTLVFKALEKSGQKLGENLINKIGQLINIIREKFRARGVEGILVQMEESPTEANKQIFQTILETQTVQDKIFAENLKVLIDELKSDSQISQIFLKNIDIAGDADIGDISQVSTSNSSVSQEAATNLKLGGNLKIGNVKQQN